MDALHFPIQRGRPHGLSHETIQHGCHRPSYRPAISNQSDLCQPCTVFWSPWCQGHGQRRGMAFFKTGFCCLYPQLIMREEMRKYKHLLEGFKASTPAYLDMIWYVTIISKMQLLNPIQIPITSSSLLIMAALMFATWLPSALKSSCHQCQWPRFKPTTWAWQTLQHKLYADRVARKQTGKHPLPSAFLWSHLLCKIAVLFTRNCYQRRGQKNDHMPWAADLCFLYLHVSQNTALYRNTEMRPQQTSSRTESFVFGMNIKVGWTQFFCKNAAWYSESQAKRATLFYS